MPWAANPEEEEGGEQAEEELSRPELTDEAVVDVRAMFTASDCRQALHSYMKAPPHSIIRPTCDTADVARTRLGILHCHHLVCKRAVSPPPAQANSIPAQPPSSFPHMGAKIQSTP